MFVIASTRKKRQEGVALVMALGLMVLVAGVVTLMFARTLGEIRHSADDAGIVQSLMLARGAANLGGSLLTTDVRQQLGGLVASNSNMSGAWSFGSAGSGETAPTPSSVIDDLAPVIAGLQTKIDGLLCGNTVSAGSGRTATVRIYVAGSTCGVPLIADVRLPGARFVDGQARTGSGSASEQEYSIPFAMIATGELGEFSRNVVLQGEYRFVVGRSSFAKYALFTNVHTSGPSGSDIWFTDRTLFDGPVHTNQFFRFYRQPWFGDEVTSAGCTEPQLTRCYRDRFGRQGAEFYGQDFIQAGRMSPSSQNPRYTNRYGTHAPELTGGVDWSADFVQLPENSQDQLAAAQGDTSNPSVRGQGLYFGSNLSNLDLWAGDELGNALVRNGAGQWGYYDLLGRWKTGAPYQYIRSCTSSSSCTVYRYGADKALYAWSSGSGTWAPVASEFNGVIYGAGGSSRAIDRITGPARLSGHANDPAYAPPALASFAEITIAAENGMRITGDLKYEDRPCSGSPTRQSDGSVAGAVCDNLSAVNVLGMYSAEGDILIGHNNSSSSYNAPRDVTIDGVLMSGEGKVTVEDYDRGNEQGTVNLTGGIIEYYYGAFGTFNSSTGQNSTGFGRTFTYDRRMAAGVSPPYFPTVGTDGVKSVKVYSFGQREQLQ